MRMIPRGSRFRINSNSLGGRHASSVMPAVKFQKESSATANWSAPPFLAKLSRANECFGS